MCLSSRLTKLFCLWELGMGTVGDGGRGQRGGAATTIKIILCCNCTVEVVECEPFGCWVFGVNGLKILLNVYFSVSRYAEDTYPSLLRHHARFLNFGIMLSSLNLSRALNVYLRGYRFAFFVRYYIAALIFWSTTRRHTSTMMSIIIQ